MTTALARNALVGVLVLTCVLTAAVAQAAPLDPGGFQLGAHSLYVHENAGIAVITVQRTNTAVAAQIRYITLGIGVPCGNITCTAISPVDFTSVKGELNFVAGQASMTFSVPIVDHGVAGMPKTIQVSLFSPYPIGLGTPSTAVLTILNDDPAVQHSPNNPLGLPSVPPSTNPLAGAMFYVDPGSEVAHAASQHPQLSIIADQPGTARFSWMGGQDPGVMVDRYLSAAAVQAPGTVPMIATYRIVSGHCGNYSDPRHQQRVYHRWITHFANGIGDFRAVLFLEMDSLITMPCLSRHGVTVRVNELGDAINVLTAHCPRLVIYLDGGAADALSARHVARLLRRAGVANIQGFFLNATHFDWTSHEIGYGEKISRLLGGKHFVVNTGENGQGPLVPRFRVRQGNEVLCNPAGRGLGPRPTSNTGYPNADAFAWTSNPGESGGACVPGAPRTAAFWPAYAMSLVNNANFAVR